MIDPPRGFALMAANTGSASVLRQLRFVVASWREDGRTDVELLNRFVQTRDEQAFSTLVGRYGELVWGVCQRVLRNAADAEDALQATFLRLARDAGRIVNREALGGWLFRVARDCAVDLRRSIARQRRIEERMTEVAGKAGDAPAADLRVLLDDELALLSSTERAVLVMICLEGRTYADAALELGCSVAAVHRRLVRAQTRLRRRFAKHGPQAAGALAGLLAAGGSGAASAAPPVLLARAVEAGVEFARSGVLPAGRAAALAGAAAAHHARPALLAGLAAVFLGGGVFAALASRTADPRSPVQIPPPATVTEADDRPVVSGVVRGPDGSPVPGAAVEALARRPFAPGERGLRDEVVATATADEAGRFTLRVPPDFETWFADRVVTVRATAAGLAPVTLPVRLAGAGEVELRAAAATSLAGRFVDADGNPAAGVRVEAVRVGDAAAEPVIGAEAEVPADWPSPVKTAADGGFRFPALGGATNVWVRATDPRFALATVRVDGAEPAVFRLEPASPLAIVVRSADTGECLPGTRVTVVTDRVDSHPHFCAADHGILGLWSLPADIDAVTDAAGTVRLNVARGKKVEVLVHPPAGGVPYVGVRAEAEADRLAGPLVVRLPRGRWVTGTVADADTGRPVAGAAVHWGREDATLPEWKDDVLAGRDAITRTGPDGTFRLAVLPGACSVRAYGPTFDHAPVRTRLPGGRNATLYAHAVTHLDVPVNGEGKPVALLLRGVAPVAGRVEYPAGTTPGAAFLLCSGRVSPVRGYAALPLPVRAGVLAVPGLVPGRVARAYVLDPVAKVGAVADVAAGSPPVVGVVPCGALRVRVVGADGTPRPGVDVHLVLLLDRDRPAGASATEAAVDAQPVEWFDAVNYPARPKTNAEGVADLPALIPGARYAVALGGSDGKVKLGRFVIESGKTTTIPDVVLPDAVEGGMR